MSKVPKIRFAGFSEEWVEKRLGEVAEIITGSTPSTSIKTYYDGKYLFVSPADIQESRYIEKTNTTLTEKGFHTGRKIRAGASLFCCIGSIGKVGQVTRAVVSNQQINAVVPNEEFDDNFVFSLLEEKSSYIKSLASINVVPIINKNTFSSLPLLLPSPDEQVLIGQFFANLDRQITNQAKQLDIMKQLKKGYLQQMFPREGELVPRIRFAGFSDEWVEKRLGDCVDYEQPQAYIVQSTNYLTSGTPVLTAGKSLLLGYTDETEGIYNKGTVIIFDDFTRDTKLINYPFKVKSSAIKLLTPIDDNNINFIFETINLIEYPLVDHKRYWISEYSNIIVFTPSPDEQELIGQFFANIDRQITGQAKQLDIMKQLKKGYLQQMFPDS